MTRRSHGFGTIVATLSVCLLCFVAAGAPAQADPTGYTWTARAGGTGALNDVAYGNGVYVAVGLDDSVSTSSDTVTWTTRSDIAGAQSWTSVAYGNNVFVAVGVAGPDSRGGERVIMTSPDGITWTARNVADGATNFFTSITFGSGVFVAVQSDQASSETVYTSPDGITWTSHAAPAGSASWIEVAFGGSQFVAVGASGNYGERENCYIMSSPDGANWTCRSLPAGADSFVSSLAYGNGMWVAGTQNQFLTSTDGATWSMQSTPVTAKFSAGAYGAGQFTFVAYDDSNGVKWLILTSPDGVTWTQRTTIDAEFWQSVSYGNGVFVAVGTPLPATPTFSVETSGIGAIPQVTHVAAGTQLQPRAGQYGTIVGNVQSPKSLTSITLQQESAISGKFPLSVGGKSVAKWTIASQTAAGLNFPVGPKNKLRLGTGQFVAYSGTSLKAGSTVSVYLGTMSSQNELTLLGSTLVGPNGTFSDTAFIPKGLNVGNAQLLNLVGTSPAGTSVSNVIGAVLRGGNAMIITYPKGKVTFKSGSAKLTQSAKDALSENLNTADRSGVLTGMVKVTYSKGKKSLGVKRGAKVQNYLENQGITGGVQVQLTKGSASKANTVIEQLAMGQ